MCRSVAGLVVRREVVLAVVGHGLGDQGVVVVFSRLRRVAGCLIRALWVALSSVLATVPPVLDCVVAAAFESSCDFSPPLAHFGDHLLDQLTLIRRDGVVVQ
jgi:hypothetical protein